MTFEQEEAYQAEIAALKAQLADTQRTMGQNAQQWKASCDALRGAGHGAYSRMLAAAPCDALPDLPSLRPCGVTRENHATLGHEYQCAWLTRAMEATK